jgi:hypothetical protein
MLMEKNVIDLCEMVPQAFAAGADSVRISFICLVIAV